MTDMAIPFDQPGSSPPRDTSARSKNSNCAWPALKGPKANPTPALLLRYVLSNPGVSVAIPGARYPDRVRRNVDLCLNYEPLTDAEKRRCEQAAKALY